jgi:methyl-accepting chemotaxis protein
MHSDLKGDYGKLAEAINLTLTRLLTITDVFECVARGDLSQLPELRNLKSRSENDRIRPAMIGAMETLQRLLDEMAKMYEAQKAGDIDALVPPEQVTGAYQKLAEGVNEAVSFPIRSILKILDVLAAYSDGDFSKVLEQLPGKQAIANEKMNVLHNNLSRLVEEMVKLTKEAVEGRLGVRADETKYKGGYFDIVHGVNDTLDAILTPIEESNRILGKIRAGDLREKMEIECQGDHQAMKDAVNGVHAWLTELIAYVTKIARGDLTAQMQKASENDQIHE